MSPEPVPSNYDEDPGRVRLARSVHRRHAAVPDVHEVVACRFVAEGFARVLDVGCGEGELAHHLLNGAWVGLDNSRTMLERAPPGGVLGEATALPFPDESFDGVAILYVLYHLPDPRLALAEAHRVMRPEGLIAVSAPSRHYSPELAHALPKGPLTFDAELVPGLLRELFEELEVVRWDARSSSFRPPGRCATTSSASRSPPTRRKPSRMRRNYRSRSRSGAPCCSPAREVDRHRKARRYSRPALMRSVLMPVRDAGRRIALWPGERAARRRGSARRRPGLPR
jgi:SAM-dependent methyltransferase